MGQKINPYGFRLGITTDWRSKWIADGEDYAIYVHEDDQVRHHVKERVRHAGISRVDITRTRDNLEVSVLAARPGIVIGRRGSEADAIRADLEKMTGKNVKLNVLEVKVGDLDAQVIAFNVAEQLRGRVSFRRAMRRAVQNAQKAGAKGIRIQVAGRLGGSEMSRTEWYREGRVPLHTLRAQVDYGFDEARTTYGRIGVKVWVYLGDVLGSGEEAEAARAMDRARALAEGRTADDRPRRQAARKAASVAKKVTGVGTRGEGAQSPDTGASAQTPATTASAPAQQPTTVTEPGETPRTDVAQATTEVAPPQSGPMDADQVADDMPVTDEVPQVGTPADVEPTEAPAAEATPTDQAATPEPEQAEPAPDDTDEEDA